MQDALAELRDAHTAPPSFRRAARRLSMLLTGEALRGAPTRAAMVMTPLAEAPSRVIDGDIVFVPVLRAGLGMLDAALDLVPSARVGHSTPGHRLSSFTMTTPARPKPRLRTLGGSG